MKFMMNKLDLEKKLVAELKGDNGDTAKMLMEMFMVRAMSIIVQIRHNR
jgi:hypothetical protein